MRMTVVGECSIEPPKEQVPKKPMEQNSQVKELQSDASLESVYIHTPPTGKTLTARVNLSGKRTEEGKYQQPFSVLFYAFEEFEH